MSNLLQGKHKPTYDPSANCGDFVVIVNAEKVEFSGNKERDKLYIHHTGFFHLLLFNKFFPHLPFFFLNNRHPGGLKKIPVVRYRKNFPERILQKAIHGMLPNNKLRGRREKKLKIYVGEEHPHQLELRNTLENVKIELAIQPSNEKAIEDLRSLKEYSTMQIQVQNIGEHSRLTLSSQQALTEFDIFEKEWIKLHNDFKSQNKLYQLGKAKKPSPIPFQHFDQFVQHRMKEELSKEIPFEGYEILDPDRYNELVKSNYSQLKPYQKKLLVQPEDHLDSVKKAVFNPPQSYLDNVATMDLSQPDYETPWIAGSRKFNFIKSNENGNYIPTKSELENIKIKEEFDKLPWPEDDPQLSKGPVKFVPNKPKKNKKATKNTEGEEEKGNSK